MLRILLMSTCFILMGGMVLYTEEQPQPTANYNATLEGIVVNQLTGQPIQDAKVGLCYHSKKMYREGFYLGGLDCDTLQEAGITEIDGSFELPALVDTLGMPTFAWLQVSHPDYETTHEIYIRLDTGRNVFGVFPVRAAQKISKKPNQPPIPERYFREKEVFKGLATELEALFPADSLSKLPSILSDTSLGSLAKCFKVQRGYNAQPKDFSHKTWDAYHTILIPNDLAVAGTVEGEVGNFTYNPNALKAQAIWARTYALYKSMYHKAPHNLQLAFRTRIAAGTLAASRDTEDLILTHAKVRGGWGNPLLAVFSARCNGDFTQAGTEAKWKPCTLGGTYNPYLLKVACSGHSNCKQGGMRPSLCCEIDTERQRYLFGHGAGGCQYGLKDFAEKYNWDFERIATHYFKGSGLVKYEREENRDKRVKSREVAQIL